MLTPEKWSYCSIPLCIVTLQLCYLYGVTAEPTPANSVDNYTNFVNVFENVCSYYCLINNINILVNMVSRGTRLVELCCRKLENNKDTKLGEYFN